MMQKVKSISSSVRVCGFSQIAGINGSNTNLSKAEGQEKLGKALETVRNSYGSVDTEKFISLFKIMLRDEEEMRPDCMFIYATCVKDNTLTFSYYERLVDAFSQNCQAEAMHYLSLLFRDGVLNSEKNVAEYFGKAAIAGHVDGAFSMWWINQYGACTDELKKIELRKIAHEYLVIARPKRV